MQRQLLKEDVADALGQGKQSQQGEGRVGLRQAELAQLFALDPRAVPIAGCDTRRMMLVRSQELITAPDALLQSMHAWPVYGGPESLADDPPAAAAVGLGAHLVTYMKRTRINCEQQEASKGTGPVPSAMGSVVESTVGSRGTAADELELSGE